jgi:hypothetical protein
VARRSICPTSSDMTKEMLLAARTGQPIKNTPMARNAAADAQSNDGIVRIKINSFCLGVNAEK